MTREDVAKAYIQSAQARAARAGVIAFGAAFALVVLWSAELQHRTGGLLHALAEKPRHTNLSRERALVQARTAAGAERLETAQHSGSKRVDQIAEYVKTLEAKASRLEEQVTSIARRTTDATTVTFRLPGLPEITVRDTSAAFVWLAFAAVLLLYLAWCRHSVLTLYSRALRILVSDARVEPHVLYDVAGPLPFWLAPLPRRDGRHVSVNLLRSAVGWDRTSNRNYLWVGLIQLAAGLIVLHVVYLGIVFSQVNVQTSNRALLLRNTPILPITVIVGLTFAGIVFWWLTPGHVPDAYSFEHTRSNELVRTRRTMLLTGLGVVAAALSLVIVSPGTLRRAILQPRFRRWANRAPLTKGFYEVGRKKIIHYARGTGRPGTLKSVPDKHLRRVDVDKDQLTRIHASALEQWIEDASARFKMSDQDLAQEGMTRTLAAAKMGQAPSLVWFERIAQDGRRRGQSDDIQRTIDALDMLASTTGGKQVDNLIQRRRRVWAGWITKLTRPPVVAVQGKTKV